MGKNLELNLLGSLEIRLAGALVGDFKSSKAQALLCYLAVTGRHHHRSSLAGLLWGDMPEAKARLNLSQALSTLRRFFGVFLNIKRQTIALRWDRDIWVDVNVFEGKVSGRPGELDIPSLQEAVDLYRGDFLESFYVRNALEFETWVMTERAKLRDLVLEALHTLSIHYAAQGEPGWKQSIDYTTRMLEIEPWQEATHRRLMRLLVLSGRRSAALKQFEDCRKTLKEELDVEPSPSTVRLLEKIRAGEFEAGSGVDKVDGASSIESLPSYSLRESVASKLPLLTTPLIGRQLELEELKELLLDPDVHLVTIVGTGGIGKTQLSLTISYQLAKSEKFREGVFFVPLSSITTLPRLISAIAEQIGLSLAGSRQPEGILFDFLRNKACLLVLDNFEQLLPDVDFLARIMRVLPQCKILVTSRERLRLREEWVLDLGGLPYPDSIQEAQASDYDAILLFSERARQVRSSFYLEEEMKGVVRICKLTQGMPLALEQAASLVRASHSNDIADQIEKRLDTLSTTLHNLPVRHRSMRAVFDGTWRWLSEEERRIFCSLSIFRGGFTREAAEQVASASLSILTALIDKSLLRLSPKVGRTTRYEMHELVQQYAMERLLEKGQAEVRRVRDSHLNYYLFIAECAENAWDTNEERVWLKHLDDERSNLHAALQWATENAKAEHALRLNAALFTFWVYNSPAAEAIDWLETSLAMTWDEHSTATVLARAKALNVAGYAALPISDFELAMAHFEEGAMLYSNMGDQRGWAWSLRGRGFLRLICGDLEEAQAFVEESQSICQEVKDEWGIAWSTYDLGNIVLSGAELDWAESLLESALKQFRKLGIQFGTYRALISLGHLKRAQGDREVAKAQYMEALSIQGETRYVQFVAQVLEGTAHIAVAEDDPDLAVQLFGAAQARRDTIEMQRWAHQEIEFQKSLAFTKNQLPVNDWQAAWDEGYAMSPQQGVAFTLDNLQAL